jgi:protein O-mannosyl-transferase
MGKRRRLRRQAAKVQLALVHPRHAPIHPPSEAIEPERLPLVQLVSVLALLVLLSAVAYRNTLQNGFVLDDIPIIVENPLIRDLGNVGTIFRSSYWTTSGAIGAKGLYRPLTVFSYAIDYAFWKLQPRGFHLVNVALHTAVTLLLFVISLRLLRSALSAFASSSIFAVHPLNTEAVTGVVGRADLLATLFFMAAFLFCIDHREQEQFRRRQPTYPNAAFLAVGAAALFYFLGLLSKEMAVTLPALLVVYELTKWKERDRRPPEFGITAARFAALGIVLLLYVMLRSRIVVTRAVWVGFAGIPFDQRILTASRVLMEYLGLFFLPKTLSADYWIPDVPIAQSAGEPRVLLSLILWVIVGVIAVYCWRKRPSLFFALAWFFVTILPVSNILFPIGVGKAERLLYLPSAGLCLFIGGLNQTNKRIAKDWIVLLMLFPVLLALSLRTYRRNLDWKDNMTLALATLQVSPTSPLFSQIAAGEYRKRGDSEHAVALLQKAVGQRPEEYSYHYNLGNAYLALGKTDQAIASYQEALRQKPGDSNALNNLGQAQVQAGRNLDAVKSFTKLLESNPRYLAVYLNLGTAYLNLGDRASAARIFSQGLAFFPNHGGLHFNLAVVLEQSGEKERAAGEYQQAFRFDPSLRKLKE